MTSDTSLKAFENRRDCVKPKWTVEKSGEHVVAHIVWSLEFTIDRPVSEVWKYMKDFNLWLEDLSYNCVVGDAAEGSTIYFTINGQFHECYRKKYGFDPKTFKKKLVVRRSEPEKLLVWEELSADGKNIAAYYAWALSERNGRTTVIGVMSYAPHWGSIEDEAPLRTSYQSMGDEVAERWVSNYIPRLRQWVVSGH